MIALLGMIFGGLLRLAPEVLKLVTQKRDQDHEYRMREMDYAQAKQLKELDMKAADQAAMAELDAKGMDAFTAAIQSQGRATGIAWIDAVSQTVRPVLTYWWMALFTAVKIATLSAAFDSGAGWSAAVLAVWTETDAAVLGGIINFWFLDRVLRRRA